LRFTDIPACVLIRLINHKIKLIRNWWLGKVAVYREERDKERAMNSEQVG